MTIMMMMILTRRRWVTLPDYSVVWAVTLPHSIPHSFVVWTNLNIHQYLHWHRPQVMEQNQYYTQRNKSCEPGLSRDWECHFLISERRENYHLTNDLRSGPGYTLHTALVLSRQVERRGSYSCNMKNIVNNKYLWPIWPSISHSLTHRRTPDIAGDPS